VKEIDINPFLASPEGLVALDARVLLHAPKLAESDLPKPAIRAYPSRYVQPWTMKDATRITIRPIRPEDEPMMVRFHSTLSDRSVYFRYFHMLKLGARVAHERLARICFIDYDREMVLVAECRDSAGNPEIIAVGRLTKLHGSDAAEFAVVISDQYQGQGLGAELLRRLVEIGRDEHIKQITGDILTENAAMLAVCRKLGFRIKYDAAAGVERAEYS
jgi:acetyltransferase